MINRELVFPDWHSDHIELYRGAMPDFSYTFFAADRESNALAAAGPEDIARYVRTRTDMSSKFLHEVISNGRVDDAKAAIDLLGGADVATDFMKHDWHSSLRMMTFDFVPEEEIQKVIGEFRGLGLKLGDTRDNIQKVWKDKKPLIKKLAPDSTTLQKYVEKYNAGEVSRFSSEQYTDTENFRILDPRRGLNYVGLGDTKDYDWLEVHGVSGFVNSAHYTAPDKETMVALLSVY